MNTAPQNVIVLRGPMGIGKSTIADQLCYRLNAGQKLNFDQGWLPTEFRYENIGRYDDVLYHQFGNLVIEIGCGEPIDLGSLGATRGAHDWYDPLIRAGANVFLFKLWASWNHIRTNMRASRSIHLLSARLWYEAYSQSLEIVSLPPELRLREHVVNVEAKPAADVADYIISVINQA